MVDSGIAVPDALFDFLIRSCIYMLCCGDDEQMHLSAIAHRHGFDATRHSHREQGDMQMRRNWIIYVVCLGGISTANSPMAAQEPTRSTPDTVMIPDSSAHAGSLHLKSPVAAAVLGTIIPGAGLAYAGHWGRGVGTYFTSVGTIGLGAMLMVADRCTFSFDSGCNPGRVWPQRTLGVASIAFGLGTLAYGAIHAYRIVERSNESNISDMRANRITIQPVLQVPAIAGTAWALGVHATW